MSFELLSTSRFMVGLGCEGRKLVGCLFGAPLLGFFWLLGGVADGFVVGCATLLGFFFGVVWGLVGAWGDEVGMLVGCILVALLFGFFGFLGGLADEVVVGWGILLGFSCREFWGLVGVWGLYLSSP